MKEEGSGDEAEEYKSKVKSKRGEPAAKKKPEKKVEQVKELINILDTDEPAPKKEAAGGFNLLDIQMPSNGASTCTINSI